MSEVTPIVEEPTLPGGVISEKAFSKTSEFIPKSEPTNNRRERHGHRPTCSKKSFSSIDVPRL